MLDYNSNFKKLISHKVSRSFFTYACLFIIIQISQMFSIKYISGSVALLAAIIWLFITIPLYILFKRIESPKYMYSMINAIIAGLTISSYYTIKSVKLDNTFLVSIGVFLFMILSYMLIVFTDKKTRLC